MTYTTLAAALAVILAYPLGATLEYGKEGLERAGSERPSVDQASALRLAQGVDTTLDHGGVDKRLDESGVDKRLDESGIDTELDNSGIDTELDNSGIDQSGLDASGIEGPSVDQAKQAAPVQPILPPQEGTAPVVQAPPPPIRAIENSEDVRNTERLPGDITNPYYTPESN